MQEIDTSRLVLWAACFSDGRKCDAEGLFVVSIDYSGNGGMGITEFSTTVDRAKTFADIGEVQAFIDTVSPVNPVVNGHEYRPLHTWSYCCAPMSQVLQWERKTATLQ